MNIDVSVIIPFLNEEDNIPVLVKELSQFFINKEFKAEVIFVDDGSSDNSIKILKTLKYDSFEASVISLSRNFGSHAALRAGIQNARGKAITFLYADLQDPIFLIDNMKEKIDEGYDIVWCNRNKTNYRFFESIFSLLYNGLMKRFVTPLFPSSGFDVVMFNQKIKNEISASPEANSSIFIQILLLGFNQTSVNYDKVKRRIGKSKWTLSKKMKLFIDSFVAFSYAPIRFVTVIGLMFSLLGILYAIYIILYSILYSNLITGWPTLIFVMMMGFGITNISLGVIAEYLWRTLDASRQRKVFIIDEIINLNEQ